MPSQGTFSIGGIASGLDTASIVQQLLQLERRPIAAIQQTQNQHRRADEAWGQIVTRLSTMRTATNKLTDPSWLQKTTSATSSNEAVARVTTSGGATPGRLAFEVERLATAHQVAVGGTVTDPETTVGGGQLTLTRGDGQQLTATLGEGATLADAARALNDLDGVSARVLRVSDGEYRLLVTAAETGSRAGFQVASTVGGIAAGDGQVLTEGLDARISMGGLTVTRPGNTIDDLIDGVAIRLTGTGAVTVDVQQDLDEGVKQVKGFVDALNGVLTQLSTASKSSPDAGTRGPLNGDPLARDLSMRLRGALSGISGDGTYRTLSSIGISLTRDGAVTLDEGTLRTALQADPQGVAALLGKASSADDARVEVSATGRAAPGTYQVHVAEPATIATRTGAAYTPPDTAVTFLLELSSGTQVELTVDAGDSLEAAVEGINGALLTAGVTTLQATVRNGAIHLAGDRAGPSRDFTVSGSGALGLDGAAVGTSAQGTITDGTDTWTLTGNGRSLSVADGRAQGLVLRVPTGVTGDLGSVTIGDGLGSVMDRVLRTAEGSGGSVARARNAVQSRIESAKASMERFEQRLEIRERSIRRQFTALEAAMAQFNAQGNWLASQLGSLG
jgi:flagellar hook-associated protein 2